MILALDQSRTKSSAVEISAAGGSWAFQRIRGWGSN
jgi:hypothetical protein